MANFIVQLGQSRQTGFLPLQERLQKLEIGKNPYVCGSALPGNSSVFYGRERELSGTLGVVRHPDRPQSVSLVGERRIGKTSLLNQIYQVLSATDQMVTIRATAQDWPVDYDKARFFAELQQAIATVLQIKVEPVKDYEGFRDFVAQCAKTYRFVLLLDEFDRMTHNPHFDTEFFRNLRALGDGGEYQWGYVLASHRSLQEICHLGEIQESKFWNIFGTKYVLGLLSQAEAIALIRQPFHRTLLVERGFSEDSEYLTPSIDRIFQHTGYHPAFIQIAAREYWESIYHRSEVPLPAIKNTLRDYYRDLWEHRTDSEKELLIKIAKNKQEAALESLELRGLINSQNQLFCEFFAEMVLQEFKPAMERERDRKTQIERSIHVDQSLKGAGLKK